MDQQSGLFRTTKGYQQNHKTTNLKCKNCSQDFLANRKTAKFCSSSCRSQFWMTKNNKKVITIAVPIDIDDDYLEKIKNMLLNYDSSSKINAEITKSHSDLSKGLDQMFDSEKELRNFLKNTEFSDFKIPKHDQGIYYDEGLTIKNIEGKFSVKITV